MFPRRTSSFVLGGWGWVNQQGEETRAGINSDFYHFWVPLYVCVYERESGSGVLFSVQFSTRFFSASTEKENKFCIADLCFFFSFLSTRFSFSIVGREC